MRIVNRPGNSQNAGKIHEKKTVIKKDNLRTYMHAGVSSSMRKRHVP